MSDAGRRLSKRGFENDEIVLSTGKEFSRADLVAIDSSGRLFCCEITHDGIHVLEEPGARDDEGKLIALDASERLELAERMIARWRLFAEVSL